MDLRVRELPEQEIGDPKLAAGAHHQLQRREALGPEAVLDRPRVDGVGVEPIGGDPARHGDDLLPPAIAERQRQGHVRVLRAVAAQRLQGIADPRG